MATAPTTGLPRNKREQQRRDTRELLFQLAIQEFRRTGTAKARVRDIVEAAGVVPGTFYFHFPTKDHVVFELWQRNSKRLLERLPSPGAASPKVDGFLRKLGDAMVDIEQEIADPELVRDSIAIMLRPPHGADPASNPIQGAIVLLLARTLERGEIESELGPAELAGVLLTSILGVLVAASDDPEERRRNLRRTIDFFLKALHRDEDGRPDPQRPCEA